MNNFGEAHKWYEKLLPESEYYSDYFEKGGNILQDLAEYADICERNGQAALLEKAQEHRRKLEAKYKKKKLNDTLSEDTIYRIS